MKQYPGESFQIHDGKGRRKYLTVDERKRFLEASGQADRKTRTLCLVLACTGCRLSEALELTAGRIDFEEGTVVFRSLKKRATAAHRAVPVPDGVLDALDLVHGVREALRSRRRRKGARLWTWSRTTAWRRVSAVMAAAGIAGPQATPKGLRHGFAIAAIQSDIPLNLLQKWLGHAHLSTTAVYADAVGAEERQIARRMWRRTRPEQSGSAEFPLLDRIDE